MIRNHIEAVRRRHKRQDLTLVEIPDSETWRPSEPSEEQDFGSLREVKRISAADQSEHSRRGLIEFLDQERGRIAAELHDSIGQVLFSLKLDLETIKGQVNAQTAALGRRIDEAIERTREGMKDLRRISLGLRPLALKDMDLVPALLSLFEGIERLGGISIFFHHFNFPRRLCQSKKDVFFRVAREALVNVVKHAGASRVHVSLIRKKNLLSMSIEDDGIGFDVKEKRESVDQFALGLLIMEERAKKAGGEFAIQSSRGRGTQILIEIPFSESGK